MDKIDEFGNSISEKVNDLIRESLQVFRSEVIASFSTEKIARHIANEVMEMIVNIHNLENPTE